MSPEDLREIQPVVEWDAIVQINTDPESDTDGEYQGESRIVQNDTNCGIPWDALEFVSAENTI